MEEKFYKTYDQLLEKLQIRGVEIGRGSHKKRIKRILAQENYYNVVNGYKELFLARKADDTTDEQYKTGTTFDEIYALYCFDREIRGIYLKYLLEIENMLKSVISHEFSSRYGHDNYLKLDNFQISASEDDSELKRIARSKGMKLPDDITKVRKISAEENISSVIKLIGDIQQETARQMTKHHQVVTHYMTEHGYIPLWVLVNVLTFGKITNFYLNMKPNDRIGIAKQFSVPQKELHKYMNMLSLARNKCAHDERFYDIRFRTSLRTNSIKNFEKLGIDKRTDGSFVSGKNDAYALAIIFAMLLGKKELKEFVKAMKCAFAKLGKKLHIISIDEVMRVMGYHDQWMNILKLRY